MGAHDGFDANLTRTGQCTGALKHGRIPFQIPLFIPPESDHACQCQEQNTCKLEPQHHCVGDDGIAST